MLGDLDRSGKVSSPFPRPSEVASLAVKPRDSEVLRKWDFASLSEEVVGNPKVSLEEDTFQARLNA